MGTWGTGLFDSDQALDGLEYFLEDELGDAPDEHDHERDPALRRILGSYRTDLDRRLGGTAPSDLVERCVAALDGLADAISLEDSIGALAALGLLVLMGRPRLPGGCPGYWRSALDALDAATTDEREFWDAYVANVRAALDRLE